MTRLRVVHAPLHGPSARREHLRHALRLGRGGVVAFSEAYFVQKYLKHRPGWRRLTGTTDRVDARGRHVGWDVTLMVRRWRRVLDHGAFKAADEIPACLKIAPERWVVWAVLGPPLSPVLVVAAHPHAAPKPGTPRGAAYAREWELIEAFIDAKREEYPELRVVLPGDLNYGDHGGPLSPEHTFRRLGMSHHAVGLDWIAWSGLQLRAHVRIVPAPDNGQDHPWLVADFTNPPRRHP